MHPDLFTIFGRTITTYGFLMAVGVLILALIFFYRTKRLEIDDKLVDILTIYSLVAGAITYLGCWFFDGLWHSLDTMMATGEPFKFEPNGITFEGGVFCGIAWFVFLFPVIFRKKVNIHQGLFFMDQLVIGILIAHCLGRLGCWYSGCCYGKEPVSWMKWIAVDYPTHDGIKSVYPTQLIEAAFLLINFIIYFFFKKKHFTEDYLITYGVYRFFAEYLRGDSRGASPFGFISPSQLMSILFVLLGIAFIFMRKYQLKKDLENKDLIENPRVMYYHFSLKGFFKPCKCPNCQNKMKLRFVDTKTLINPVEIYKERNIEYYCSNCQNNESK